MLLSPLDLQKNYDKNSHFFIFFIVTGKNIHIREPLNLTSEAARLSSWQPAALQAARQCARPTKDNKKHYTH